VVETGLIPRRAEPFFRRIESSFSRLSRNQRMLARYVVAQYQRVAFLTIRQLAEASRVSEATVVRFVKALEFAGYPAFQAEIRRIVRADLNGTERFRLTHTAPQTARNPLAAVLAKEAENLSNLQSGFDEAEFRRAVSAIRRATEVVVVGSRSTASLAYHFWFGLSKMAIPAIRMTAITSESYDRLHRLDAGALIVLIGFPRYLNEWVDLLEFARGQGLRTLTITDSPFSPLRGDISLFTPAESASFVAFHCAPMTLINAVLNALGAADKRRTLAALQRFERLAQTRRYFHTG
jgi:DNA-binding MurR/RpiR family transcriptional regulator